jgi:four helix bundle protein
MGFVHEKLEVYRAAIEYVGRAYRSCEALNGHRNAKDQHLRASQAIPLNIAEGNGKATHGDRRRYFKIARGSALECGAAQAALQACGAMPAEDNAKAKALLDRIVAMLTTLGQRGYVVRETPNDHGVDRIDTDPDSDPDTDGGREPRNRQQARAAERCRAR